MPRDFWPDANKVPKHGFDPIYQAIRAVRDRRGLKNCQLAREVRQLIRAHNAVPGRRPVKMDLLDAEANGVVLDDKDYALAGNDDLRTIRNRGRRYLVGYLAWLWEHDRQAAQALYDQIGLSPEPTPPAGPDQPSWSGLIDRHAQFGAVEVVSLQDHSLGLVGFKSDEPIADERIELGQPFCFRLTLNAGGFIIAMQRYRGVWYPMALSNSGFHDRVDAGITPIPKEPGSGQPIPLCEKSAPGTYGFAFVVTGHEGLADVAACFREEQPLAEKLAADLAALFELSPPDQRVIHRINVEIVP